MAGFIGCSGIANAGLRLERMERAPTVVGPVARAATSPLSVFGSRDASIVEHTGAALALAGYVRRGRKALDARALLEAWRSEGEALLLALTGEFAFAVVENGVVHVARDRHGSRPVYVGELPRGGIVFGTSIAPLVYAGVPVTIDHDALVRSLVLGYPTAPQTALARVRQLGPGEIWTLGSNTTRRRYYMPREQLVLDRPLSRATRAIDTVVTRAVRDALPRPEAGEAAGRVGAFLSGGMDSAIVLARLHELGVDVDAFTIYFGDRLPGEIRYARAVARHLGVRHHVFELDARKFCDGIDATVLHLEDVLSEAIAIPNYLLAKRASREVSVLFTGEGGDQSFGGPKNVPLAVTRAYSDHPAAPPLGDAYARIHQYLASDIEMAFTDEVRGAFDVQSLYDAVANPYFGDGAARGPENSFVGGVMIGNTIVKGGNNILPKVAKTIGAAHDLALRCPMFDPRVVETAFTIPPWQKLRGALEEKIVLRRAALRSLPAYVVNRPKRGMSLPLDAWMDGPLGARARDVLTRRAIEARGIFRWDYVERLLARAPLVTDLAKPRSTEKLWLVLVTELHLQALERLERESKEARRAA